VIYFYFSSGAIELALIAVVLHQCIRKTLQETCKSITQPVRTGYLQIALERLVQNRSSSQIPEGMLAFPDQCAMCATLLLSRR
jgi:hypothetical protein